MHTTRKNASYSKLGIGPFALELLNHIKAMRNGDPSAPKLFIGMGHDTTTMSLMAGWGVWNGIWWVI